MEWLESRKKSLEWSIKFTSKGLACQIGLLLFNIAGMAWNGYGLYHDAPYPAMSGFGVGAFASNFLWTLCQCAKWYGDIRGEKSELKYIHEIEHKERLNEDREFYNQTKKSYDEALARLMRDNGQVIISTTGGGGGGGVGSDTPTEPEKSGCGDSFVCTKADVQNCH